MDNEKTMKLSNKQRGTEECLVKKMHKVNQNQFIILCRHTKYGKRWKNPLIFSEMMVK